jgi:CDP-2,3-bis-(O-geranylgeranyl)-sn-glycerol synthase
LVLEFILESMYFFVPAYFANMAPVFIARVKWLKKFSKPIDHGIKLGKETLFGSHKTWRGFISGVLTAVIVSALQYFLYQTEYFSSISIVDYSSVNVVLYGFLLGFGAMFGDLVKSFFKRRLNRTPGSSWPIFDQLDFVIGAFVFLSIVYVPPVEVILFILIITPLIALLANIIGYALKIKKVWW